MKKILIALITLSALSVQARSWTSDEVKELIVQVNTYWQQNNPAEVRAFWDNAAYHTGNMEVYKLLADRQMLDYSLRWANHNQWKGATEPDPSKWKYKNYGEGQDYVLFGDWQICFQTYIDLFLMEQGEWRSEKNVERALEVMGYEADSPACDYWWWADALYMVMPVMTKMYRLTGEQKYLDKLYCNLLYSDSIMLDAETGLYFRDGKYVYPKHQTANGKKDFWARGDGWVLAGLAKVLQDMPKDYVHQPFFVSKFVRLARAVARLQQPQGYWTRSMMDPQQAPGPETSGTAFFCYGLLWGVNHGYLQAEEFVPVIDKAWKYLTETALQPSGRIGYVQPIGERAIPGQKVDSNSQANFGVGAFLLAACEYCRYIEKKNPQPFPKVGDAFWLDTIPAAMRQSYISYGEQWLGKPWTVLPWTVFAENKLNGNRVNYETICFAKRRQLAALVMAEVMEGKGRFTNDIIDGLGSFCEETWWGIPAHYGKRIPLTETQEVDLFNAETASLIAWTSYMMAPQLMRFAPELRQRIDGEIQRRILRPALKRDYWWKKAGMNWNPWICSNWLTCVLLCEHDDAQKQAAIAQITRATQTFINAYPEDGGCDEGPGYWDRAAASMFEVLNLLSVFGQDSCAQALYQPNEAKIRAMASYAYKTYIGNGYCVNFADAHENKAVQQVNIVYPFGLFLNDRTMREFGAYLGRQRHILEQPAALYDKSGNFPTLGRELFFLSHLREFMAEQLREPLLADVWLPDLQIMAARRGSLYVAMKGGHNDESHNHNDVGSFIVYADSAPLLIDPGVGEYTAKTFSKDRYSIWTMQSQYHNLPQPNGVDQQAGRQHAARVVSHRNGQLCLDLAAAYPEQAAVRSWQRTVSLKSSAVTIVEDYELSEYRQPSRLMLLTTVKPSVTKPGTVSLGSHRITYDARQLSAAVEDISHQLDPLLQGMWGKTLYRIVLTVQSTATKNKIKYTVR